MEADMAGNEPIRVLVADDHAVVGQGIREVLRRSGEFDVVGLAGDGCEAVQMAREFTPDVIIMDVLMPVKNGIDACREITELLPETRVLILTASTSADAVVESVAAGATGYLVKDSGADLLVETLREVVAGRFHLTADELRRAAGRIRRNSLRSRPLDPTVLTPRERDVLVKFCEGMSYAQIAGEYDISRSNVRNTIYRIHDKTGSGSNQEMVVWAVRSGLLDDWIAGG